MPRHQPVTECRHGGPVSKFCSCHYCTLAICSVCGAYEGSLTTDCPGEKVDFDRQQEVYKTNLDYVDSRGWHQGEPMKRRSPRFKTKAEERILHTPRADLALTRIISCSCGWQVPQGATDSDTAYAQHVALVRLVPSTSTDWSRVDRTMELQHVLTQKAIAWVMAARICDDHSASLTRIEDEVDAHLKKGQDPNEHDRELLSRLEYEKIGFRLADQRAQKCDTEFREAARKLVDALETKA
jgi:hypothetical protein